MKIISHDLTFSQALELLKKGNKVSKASWSGKNQFLFLVPGSQFVVNRAPLMGIYPEGATVEYHGHIDMKTSEGYVTVWNPTQPEMLSNDWVLLS